MSLSFNVRLLKINVERSYLGPQFHCVVIILSQGRIINVDNCKIYHDKCPPNGNKNTINNNTPALM